MKCEPPTPAQDGFIKVANFRGEYIFGSIAIYQCNLGFILWGNSHRTCTEKGEWSGSLPTCRTISCGEPLVIQNSAMEHLDMNAVVTYSCLPGFIPTNGTTKLTSTNSFIDIFQGSYIEFQSICQTNGSWSPVKYECKHSEVESYARGSFFLILLIGGIIFIVFTTSVLMVTTWKVKNR